MSTRQSTYMRSNERRVAGARLRWKDKTRVDKKRRIGMIVDHNQEHKRFDSSSVRLLQLDMHQHLPRQHQTMPSATIPPARLDACRPRSLADAPPPSSGAESRGGRERESSARGTCDGERVGRRALQQNGRRFRSEINENFWLLAFESRSRLVWASCWRS